mgnify:CR=1 FL=1
MKVADMHCDTIAEIYAKRQAGEECGILKNNLHIDLEKMERGDYAVQNFAVFAHMENLKGKMPLPEYALRLIDTFFTELRRYPDRIGIVRSFRDIEKNMAEGRMSALLTMEEGAICQGKLEYLRIFYELGVRMFTFTWNFPNELAYPNRYEYLGPGQDSFVPETEKGLTEKGFEFLEEMERLGIIADVSHLGDKGILDVISHAKRPFVASHSDARAICPAVRNLTDDMICLLAEKGGVTGLNFCPSFLNAQKDYPGTAADVARHAAHIIKVGGEDCLGLGSDFDGIRTHAELPGADAMPVLEGALAKAGLTARQRDKVMGENVLRVYREVLG